MIRKQIKNLKNKTLDFAYLVADMLDKCLLALKKNDLELFDKIINEMELEANKTEVKIDKYSILLIARFGPMASNLRTTVMSLKINNDLERMADHCVRICRCGKQLAGNPVLAENKDNIIAFGELVRVMLKDGIMSFENNDSKIAQQLFKKDIEVNKLRDKRIEQIISDMKESPLMIENYLQLIKIYERLERIANLTTNLAENAFFISKGKVIKHKMKK